MTNSCWGAGYFCTWIDIFDHLLDWTIACTRIIVDTNWYIIPWSYGKWYFSLVMIEVNIFPTSEMIILRSSIHDWTEWNMVKHKCNGRTEQLIHQEGGMLLVEHLTSATFSLMCRGGARNEPEVTLYYHRLMNTPSAFAL